MKQLDGVAFDSVQSFYPVLRLDDHRHLVIMFAPDRMHQERSKRLSLRGLAKRLTDQLPQVSCKLPFICADHLTLD